MCQYQGSMVSLRPLYAFARSYIYRYSRRVDCGRKAETHGASSRKCPPLAPPNQSPTARPAGRRAVVTMRVLLADDHDLVRDGIQAYLQSRLPSIEVVTACNFQGALALAATVPRFDLVLLDLRMPGMDGAAGLEQMRAVLPNVPLAILSGYPCPPELSPVLARLRVSFLPKTISGDALIVLLNEAMPRETIPTPSHGHAGGSSGPGLDPTSETRPLTRREREVLCQLSLGLSNKEIARRLGIEEVTVRLHLRGIFRKLGVHNRTQAVRHAINHGLDITTP